MKNTKHLFLTFILLFSIQFSFGQESCKVLKPQIADVYSGKCKNGFAHGKGIATGTDRYEGFFNKGLPHGEGTYTWANGSTYQGEWTEGMRNGIGKYTMFVNGKDSIQEGFWQNDVYKGKKPDKPFVTLNSGVDRYNFRKSNSHLNRVMIDILQNGSRNKKISGFNMTSSSGQDISTGFLVGYNNVEFPVTIKIAYTTLNKLGSAAYYVKFDFIIYEPGDWMVELNN